MKPDIHPNNYRPVVFRDITTGEEWVTRSTVRTEKTTEYEGQKYPLFDLPVSASSHPFYTGRQKLVDTEGRVERFRKKYGQTNKTAETK